MTDNQETFNFVPFDPSEDRRGGRGRSYTPEEDQKILDKVSIAEEAGIPLLPVFHKLAEEMPGRTQRAIEIHYYILKKRINGDQVDSDEDEEDEDGFANSITARLKILVREREFYKNRYEGMKDEYDRMKSENEKLSKEMKQIRRLLG